MPVTQKDIALRLNLSPSAVAGVLNNSRHVRVTSENRTRVLEVAREMGYVPQAAAQMLRKGRTNRVAFVYLRNSFANIWYSSAIEAAAQELAEIGYSLDVKVCADMDACRAQMTNMAGARSCDAAILWGMASEVTEQGPVLESITLPFVAFGYHERNHPNWIQIDFDHRGMIDASVRKLVELGHRRIAFLGHSGPLHYTVNFLEGFHDAIARHVGVPVPSEWILLHDEWVVSKEAVANRVASWLAMPESDRPTAFAFGNAGSIAATIEAVLLARGYQFGDGPGRFSIAGISYPVELLAGEGWAFGAASSADITRLMIRDQMAPLLKHGEPKSRLIRYLPELAPSGPPIIGRMGLNIRQSPNHEITLLAP